MYFSHVKVLREKETVTDNPSPKLIAENVMLWLIQVSPEWEDK